MYTLYIYKVCDSIYLKLENAGLLFLLTVHAKPSCSTLDWRNFHRMADVGCPKNFTGALNSESGEKRGTERVPVRMPLPVGHMMLLQFARIGEGLFRKK